MGLSIPITGVSIDYVTPGNFAEILFAQGPGTASAPGREVVFAMPLLSTGSGTAGTLVQLKNEGDAVTVGGIGSPIHRAARIFFRANKTAKVWALPVAETSGGSPSARSFTITIATTATGTGTVSFVFGEDTFSASFKSGDTVTTIATALNNSIAAAEWLPFTPSPSAGVITCTYRLKGTSQNNDRVSSATITAGVGTTVTLGGATPGVEGSTTEAANLTTALNNINAVRKYYIVSSESDATGLGNLKTHIANKSVPRVGLRSVGIAGTVDTLANATTLATGLNYERLQIVWQKNSDYAPLELAASMAALRQQMEETDPTFNFDLFTGPQLIARKAATTSDWPTGDDMSDAIKAGLTTIGSQDSGGFVVMSCTTRSKNTAGTVNDPRARQSHRVSEADQFTDELLVLYGLNYGQKKVEDDEFLADGTINRNQRLKRNVVRPSMTVGLIKKLLDDHDKAGNLQNVAASKNSIRAVKTGGRIEVSLDLNVIDWLDQTTTRVAEVSTG